MINITDIYGNTNINNNTSFLVIYNFNLKPYLLIKDKDINGPNSSYIYTLNYKLLNKQFEDKGLNINKFLLVSDIFSYENNIINKILLVNINICTLPLDYISVEFYNKGTIWEPIGITGYKSLGLIYKNGNDKPELNEIPLIPTDLLIKLKNGPSMGLKSSTEFKILSNNRYGLWMIDKSKISSNKNDYFKLLTFDNKFLNKVNDKYRYIKNNKYSNDFVIKNNKNKNIIIAHNENPWYLSKNIAPLEEINYNSNSTNNNIKNNIKPQENFNDNQTGTLYTVSIIIISIALVIVIYKYKQSLLKN
jgi:hypothetical protein